MIQGQALSLFVRAARCFPEAGYEDTARLIFRSLADKNGGDFAVEEEEGVWYEEYEGEFRSYVLNGFLFAAWGIFDYALFSGESAAAELWSRCLDSARKRLRMYEWRFGPVLWTVYDLKYREPCSTFYQRLHCDLLWDIARVTEDTVFAEYEKRWRNGLKFRHAMWALARARNLASRS
jgi:hypothetical protein